MFIYSRLSLKFLAWYLLNESVQVATHDSIEDARTALRLYHKYLELKEAGTLQDTLRDIYDKGNSLGFKPP
jgi:PAB-dependent poly(A)-specific ribonuclease subunit 2